MIRLVPRCLVLACASLVAASPLWAQSTPAPEAAPAAAITAKLPEKPVHVEEGALLKGVTQVAIPSFQVYVLTDQSASASAQGGSRTSTLAGVYTELKVSGLTPERLKALTNQLYDETVRQLQAQGIRVLPREQLQALPAYAALQAVGDPDGLAIDTRGGKGQVFAAYDLPVIHLNEMAWLHRNSGGLFGGPKVEDLYVSLGDTVSGGFKIGKVKPPLQALAQAAQLPLLQVRLVMTAAQLKAKGGGFFSQEASTQAQANLALPAFTNRFLLMTLGGDFARVSLNANVLSEEGLGQIRDVTSSGQVAANVAVTALTMAAAAFGGVGRGVVQNNRDLELVTTPETFDAVSRPYASAVLAALSQGLAAGHAEAR